MHALHFSLPDLSRQGERPGVIPRITPVLWYDPDHDMTNPFEQLYSQDPDIVSRRIADETILVPVRGKTHDLDSLYTLNDSGARAWELVDGRHSLGQIRDRIVSEYEVGPEEAGADLIELMTALEQIGAVVKV